ncbi:MAG: exodeoxyribonuclease III [Planctomycetes bacterium]|nr:exodeoxyribonuclease III [Planctomycetota bacterium]
MAKKKESIRLVSWNVNGIRACVKNGFLPWFQKESPDILSLSEVRALPDQMDDGVREPKGYHTYFHAAEKKGYSGVGLLCKKEPKSVETHAFKEDELNSEGRLIISDHEDFILYSTYFPNSGPTNDRLPYKLKFCDAVVKLMEKDRKAGRKVVLTGDINVAHTEIDLANPKTNTNNAGFLPEEREWVTKTLAKGYVDIFRKRNEGVAGLYTWWSNRPGVREKNVGWRIDYYLITPDLEEHVVDAKIHPEIWGSDHCPVSIELAF